MFLRLPPLLCVLCASTCFFFFLFARTISAGHDFLKQIWAWASSDWTSRINAIAWGWNGADAHNKYSMNKNNDGHHLAVSTLAPCGHGTTIIAIIRGWCRALYTLQRHPYNISAGGHSALHDLRLLFAAVDAAPARLSAMSLLSMVEDV